MPWVWLVPVLARARLEAALAVVRVLVWQVVDLVAVWVRALPVQVLAHWELQAAT